MPFPLPQPDVAQSHVEQIALWKLLDRTLILDGRFGKLVSGFQGVSQSQMSFTKFGLVFQGPAEQGNCFRKLTCPGNAVGHPIDHGAELVTTRTAWLMARMLTLDVQRRPTSETLAYWRSSGMHSRPAPELRCDCSGLLLSHNELFRPSAQCSANDDQLPQVVSVVVRDQQRLA